MRPRTYPPLDDSDLLVTQVYRPRPAASMLLAMEAPRPRVISRREPPRSKPPRHRLLPWVVVATCVLTVDAILATLVLLSRNGLWPF